MQEKYELEQLMELVPADLGVEEEEQTERGEEPC